MSAEQSVKSKDNVIVEKDSASKNESSDENEISLFSVYNVNGKVSTTKISKDNNKTDRKEKSHTNVDWLYLPSLDETSESKGDGTDNTIKLPKCKEKDPILSVEYKNGSTTCEGVYMPIFEPSLISLRPTSRYVENNNCTEFKAPEVEYTDILVNKEIDEYEQDYLSDDEADFSGE